MYLCRQVRWRVNKQRVVSLISPHICETSWRRAVFFQVKPLETCSVDVSAQQLCFFLFFDFIFFLVDCTHDQYLCLLSEQTRDRSSPSLIMTLKKIMTHGFVSGRPSRRPADNLPWPLGLLLKQKQKLALYSYFSIIVFVSHDGKKKKIT